MAEFTVKGQWRKGGSGHIYTARAVTGAGRVLAMVNVEVPLDVAMDMRGMFGGDLVDEIERSAKQDAERVAEGWDHLPKKVSA